MQLKYNLLFLATCIAILLPSCKKQDPILPNEEELITSMMWTLVAQGTTDTLRFSFQDLDGDGGNDPILMLDTLQAGTTYNSNILLLNELGVPADTITNEVLSEAEQHQFFYQSSTGKITASYTDSDGTNPIGIQTEITTGAAGTDTLTITLRHEPDKFATGVSSGDISNAGGETDIQVSFEVVIE